MNDIKLGDKVRSSVSGFSGTVTAITHYLHGETYYSVTAHELTDGEQKAAWFSIGELEKL